MAKVLVLLAVLFISVPVFRAVPPSVLAQSAQVGGDIKIPVEPLIRHPGLKKSLEPASAFNPRSLNDWAYQKVGIPAGYAAPQVKIMVVDTGANAGEGLSPVWWKNYITGQEGEAAGADTNGHGTGIAGIIASDLGYLSQAQLYIAKCDDGQGFIVINAAMDAIDDAISLGIDIINLSFGGQGTAPGSFRRVIDKALAAGIVVVAGAGNFGLNLDQSGFYPADLPGIVALAGSNQTDELIRNLSGQTESDYGFHTVPLAAPAIMVVVPSTAEDIITGEGTSASAPAFCASLAYLMTANGLTGAQAREMLLESVDPVTDLVGLVSTCGRINAGRAQSGELDPQPEIQLPPTLTVPAKQSLTIQGKVQNPTGECIASFSWSFGDGMAMTTSLPEASHRYKKPGNYAASCTVLTVAGQTVATMPITVTKRQPG